MNTAEEKATARGNRFVYQGQHNVPASHQAPKSCCSKICSCIFSPIGLCILLIIYGVIGAFTFRALELNDRPRLRFNLKEIRAEAINKVWNITMEFNILYQPNWTRKVTDEIMKFEKDIIKGLSDQLSADKAPTNQNWTFFRSLLYSLTLITTIGHGSVTPDTTYGKIITIMYAVFGIPLMLLYLTKMGDLLARIFKSLYCSVLKKKKKKVNTVMDDNRRYDEAQMQCPLADSGSRGKIYTTDDILADRCHVSEMLQERQHIASIHRPVQCVRLQTLTTLPEESGCQVQAQTGFKRNGDLIITDTSSVPNQQGMNQQNSNQLCVTLIISIFIVLVYLFSGAAMFYIIQNWTYVDSVFFCFTSLTTIGFGNFDPGDNLGSLATDIKIVLCYIYLTLGMAIIAMCFNLMQEVIIKRNKVENHAYNIQSRDRPDIYC